MCCQRLFWLRHILRGWEHPHEHHLCWWKPSVPNSLMRKCLACKRMCPQVEVSPGDWSTGWQTIYTTFNILQHLPAQMKQLYLGYNFKCSSGLVEDHSIVGDCVSQGPRRSKCRGRIRHAKTLSGGNIWKRKWARSQGGRERWDAGLTPSEAEKEEGRMAAS